MTRHKALVGRLTMLRERYEDLASYGSARSKARTAAFKFRLEATAPSASRYIGIRERSMVCEPAE